MIGPIRYFENVKDPRMKRKRRHELSHVIALALIAVIGGATTWNEVQEICDDCEEWLAGLLGLKNGIPSHDTFNRVFSLLDPRQMERSFLRWTQEVVRLTEGEVIAIDGKSLRGSGEGGAKPLVHMVSAWASKNGLVLGQVKVDDKTNEIKAIPELLSMLIIKGCIVTIDAMGCQKEIAQRILDRGADYLLATKGNQGRLVENIEESFGHLKADNTASATDFGHGRIETRTCSVLSDLRCIEDANQWPSLRTIAKIESTRVIKRTGQKSSEIRYYISSLPPDAAKINTAVREHWGVENKLHWQLDVTFSDDASLKSSKYAAQNFTLLNRIALNQLRHSLHPNPRNKNMSMKSKRSACIRRSDYWKQCIMTMVDSAG
jgi:predicted transposase YbfD/YdcC